MRGPNVGMKYELGERARIGRAADNEIQVADPGISRVHAEVLQVPLRQAWTIHDRESRNGVLVNGEPVREKALLRGDEIQVGDTLLVFNSDLNVCNARFSSNTVYLYPSDAETIVGAQRTAGPGALAGPQRETAEFLLRLSRWFSAPAAPVGETAERLMRRVMELFAADSGLLLLRDPALARVVPPGESVGRAADPDAVGRELVPVVALPVEEPGLVNRGLIMASAAQKQALGLSEPAGDLARLGKGHLPESGSQGLCTMCAPMLEADRVTGMLVIEKREAGFYALPDLALLEAIANLATGAMREAGLHERVVSVDADAGSGPGIVATRNARVQGIFQGAQRAAPSGVTILITGESGTGKEVLARFVHESSPRANGPFIALNCGAIPPTLFESELFGYEKGSFTGAARTTPGKIEAAHGGTLFLDEVGELDLALQPKLLRFLQDKAFYRVGATRAITADVRIVAATNANLAEAVREGRFREDLWYRLNVVAFEMPPLRERREDIPALVDFLVRETARRMGRPVLGVDDNAMALLDRHPWPGNIRELANAVERAVLLCPGRILTAADFSTLAAHSARKGGEPTGRAAAGTPTDDAGVIPMAQVERLCIERALRQFAGNQVKAAEALGFHRNTLRNKIVEYGIDVKEARDTRW